MNHPRARIILHEMFLASIIREYEDMNAEITACLGRAWSTFSIAGQEMLVLCGVKGRQEEERGGEE